MKEDRRTAEIRCCGIKTGYAGQRLVDYIKVADPWFNWGGDDPLELVNFATRRVDPPYDVIEPPDDEPPKPPTFRVVG